MARLDWGRMLPEGWMLLTEWCRQHKQHPSNGINWATTRKIDAKRIGKRYIVHKDTQVPELFEGRNRTCLP